jgi:hypothetical protein
MCLHVTAYVTAKTCRSNASLKEDRIAQCINFHISGQYKRKHGHYVLYDHCANHFRTEGSDTLSGDTKNLTSEDWDYTCGTGAP